MDGNDSPSSLKTSFSGRGIYPVAQAHWLLNPLRHLISPASLIVGRLHLKQGDGVLEIGPGPGYFSPSVARRIRPGRLVLFDIQPAMLELAKGRLLRRKLTNFDCRAGNATALPFPAESFDVVFMVTVLGEVGDEAERASAIGEAARVLRPGGLLSISEQFGDPDYVRVRELEALAAAGGLKAERRFGPRFFYTYNFRKPAGAA